VCWLFSVLPEKGSDILSIALISFEDYSRYSVVKERLKKNALMIGQVPSKLNRETEEVKTNVINLQDSRSLLNRHRSLERR